jgi:hypothetical protein
MDTAIDARDEVKRHLFVEVLRSFGEARLAVTGASMLPAVWPGDILEVRRTVPVGKSKIANGTGRRAGACPGLTVPARFPEADPRVGPTVPAHGCRAGACPGLTEPAHFPEADPRVGPTARAHGCRAGACPGLMVPAHFPEADPRVGPTSLGADISPGELVLFARAGGLVAHRVVRLIHEPGRTLLVTRGDRLRDLDPPVSPEELLGVVTGIVRDGRRLAPRLTRWGRMASWVFTRSDLCTRIALHLRRAGACPGLTLPARGCRAGACPGLMVPAHFPEADPRVGPTPAHFPEADPRVGPTA